jgi:hypothetical protein
VTCVRTHAAQELLALGYLPPVARPEVTASGRRTVQVGDTKTLAGSEAKLAAPASGALEPERVGALGSVPTSGAPATERAVTPVEPEPPAPAPAGPAAGERAAMQDWYDALAELVESQPGLKLHEVRASPRRHSSALALLYV